MKQKNRKYEIHTVHRTKGHKLLLQCVHRQYCWRLHLYSFILLNSLLYMPVHVLLIISTFNDPLFIVDRHSFNLLYFFIKEKQFRSFNLTKLLQHFYLVPMLMNNISNCSNSSSLFHFRALALVKDNGICSENPLTYSCKIPMTPKIQYLKAFLSYTKSY